MKVAAPAERARFWLGTTIEMERAGRRLRKLRKRAPSLDDLIQVAMTFRFKDTFIRPLQLKSEIQRLLSIVEDVRPDRLLEIGTASGGTLYLFASVSSPNARIVSLDWEPYRDHPCNPTRLRLYRLIGLPGQHITVMAGDSHDPATVGRVRKALSGPVDFLFVDGDHSYDGVKLDAELYLPLLRSGGIAAFHDIRPDVARNATGVYDWWREFSDTHEVEEFVENTSQAGYGIGIWRKP